MHVWKLATNAPRQVNSLAVGAAVALIFKVLVLNRFAPAFAGAYKLGLITEGLLTSIIASYVFYLVVVRFKEESDFQSIYPYLSKHSKSIVSECKSQLKEISKETDQCLCLDSLDEKSIQIAFAKIDPYSQAPLILDHAGTYANWFQYFQYHRDRSLRGVRKLFDQLKFLQAEHVVLVSNIDDCSHFMGLDILQTVRVKNPNLSTWAKTFYSYCVYCKELDSYNKKLEKISKL